ncbi:alanine racemase [Wolinella succinogenes]|uniref:alanine racemase n=1 Tax=Wolinella succinogenes TaxID=844 RepID=UPI002FC83820
MAELRINSQAFFHNLKLLADHVGSKEKVAVVLKDNAYGHGLLEIALLCKEAGIASAFVKNEAEAIRIAPYFESVTALYGDVEPKSPANVWVALHSLEQIRRIPKGRSVELKVDTGMNRNGIMEEELFVALEAIRTQGLILCGVMAHNGYGDELGSEFFSQQRRFEGVRARVEEYAREHGLPRPRFHALSSSGALRSRNIQDDLVRFGIAIYGYLCAHPLVVSEIGLRPVLSLWARRITTKSLLKGARIGYGGKSELEEEAKKVSTYDVGYGDGFYRLNEHHKLLTAQGERILPRVSMDCLSVVGEREEVCLMEDASELARLFDTIPYEVLTRFSPFLKRVVI